MSPKTRAGAKLDAQLAAPAPGSRAARKQARDERLGITAQPDPPPQLPTTKKRPRKTVVAPKEVEEAPPQTPERSVKKAKVQTPQSIESTRPSTPPIEVQRFLTTAWTEGNQRYFDSSWGTKFLRSQAPIEPWINEEVWAEHVPLGSIAQRLPERIRTVEIDVGSGRWMNRIYCDIPLFHVVEKTVPAPTNALPAASPHKPPPRPHPELYDSPFKRPFVPRPSTAAATQHPAVRPRPPPAKAKDASATVSHVYTLPKNTRMEPLDSEQYYDTPEEAVEVAKTAALRQGFQLSIHRSKGTERKKYELGCYKGGRLPEERKKKAQALPQEALDALEEAGTKVKRGAQSSRMIGCPYKLVVQARLPNHQYQIFTVHGEHNHPPERDIGLVKGNALKDKERGLVEKWRKQNPHSKPLNFLKTLNELRKENDEPLLPKQKLITNHLSREKARRRANMC